MTSSIISFSLNNVLWNTLYNSVSIFTNFITWQLDNLSSFHFVTYIYNLFPLAKLLPTTIIWQVKTRIMQTRMSRETQMNRGSKKPLQFNNDKNLSTLSNLFCKFDVWRQMARVKLLIPFKVTWEFSFLETLYYEKCLKTC